MNSVLTEKLISAVVSTAKEAGKAILEITDKKVSTKDDESPLTAADQASNNVILKELATYSSLPIVSEEALSDEVIDLAKTSQQFWLVDPLDGTKEFIKGNGEYTVNIALIDAGKPVLGVVYAPELDLLYYAMKGYGAFRQKGSLKVESLPAEVSSDRPYRVVVSRSHLSDETVAYIDKEKLRHPGLETKSIGSSLKMCLVAEGSADVYPRLGPTMLWDTAAAHAVVNEAGMNIFQFDGSENNRELNYQLADLGNSSFICH